MQSFTFILTGYKLSNSAFNMAVMRYSDKQGFIKFDDFVACVVRLKTLFGMCIIIVVKLITENINNSYILL